MHSQKKLIVNADDFGISEDVNQGIVQAHSRGIVTSASVMACAKAFGEAAQLGKENVKLGLGAHLVLNEESAAAPKERIGSLIDERKGTLLDLTGFLQRYFRGKIVPAQVYLEFEAQIKKILDAGIKPTHLDGHKHIHLLPGILEIVLELAEKYRIRRLRLSREPWPVNLLGGKCGRALPIWCLSRLAHFQLAKIRKHKLVTPDYCYGLTQSGNLDDASLARLLCRVACGTNELICHPGLYTGEVSSQKRSRELECLKSAAARDLARRLDIQLVRYDEIN